MKAGTTKREEGAQAPASPRVGIATHYARYSAASVLTLLAGFVSFPLLTRLLSNHEYGILGYFETWVMLAVALAKLGAQHSIIRFYPDGADAHKLRHFATNLVLIPAAASLGLWLVVALILGSLYITGVFSPSAVFWLALLLIPFSVIGRLVEMIFRASERSMLLTVTRVGKRWLELALILGAVILLQRSAAAVYIGKVATAGIAAVFYVIWVKRNFEWRGGSVDANAIRTSLVYGLPLVANELSAIVLGSIDRVMLKELLGEFAAVGVYTIGYSLALNVSAVMSATLNEAFVPVANRLYSSEGDAAVRDIKSRMLLPMTYASIGIAAMIWCVGGDALVALSGPGKASSGVVFAAVGALFAISPLIDVSGYGLLLHKRSATVFSITIIAALLNIALNFIMIPRLGVMGAVWATVISTLAMGAMQWWLCPRSLLQLPDRRAFLIAVACTLPLLLIVTQADLFGLNNPWYRLFAAGAVFLVTYVVPIWVLDARIRALVSKWLPARVR